MRSIMLGALVLSFVAATGTAQEDAVKVEPVQLTIRKKPSIDGVQVFGQPGLELQVAVLVPNKPILSVDADKSRLVKFVDDQGTDLKKGAPTGFFSWVSMSTAFRDEPIPSAMLDIKTETLPAKKAGRIELEAVVALVSAKGTEEKSQTVAMKKDAKVTCGPVPMTISSVDKSNFGDGGVTIGLSSDQRMDAIKELKFFDAAGKELEAKPMGESSFGFAGKKTYTKTFGLPERLEQLTVKVVSHANMETIEVPIKLSIGAGL